jgi:hypothetical protein
MTMYDYSVFQLILMITITGFFLNLLWEVLHSMLYDWDKPPLINNIYKFIPRIVFFASLFDAVFIMIFLLINSAINNGFKWVYTPVSMDYLILAIMGVITAILIEIWAVKTDQWSYHKRMPVVFGIGLTPLVQLALTSCLSLYLVSQLVIY